MFGLGIPEILLIALVFGVLFFGGERIAGFAKSLGRATGEFRKGKREIEKELRAGEEEANPAGEEKHA
jgi:sec-independent protein translocase protein TatA